jgi:hypothetical protein
MIEKPASDTPATIPGFTKRTALEPYGHPIEPVRATRHWEEAIAEYLREDRGAK